MEVTKTAGTLDQADRDIIEMIELVNAIDPAEYEDAKRQMLEESEPYEGTHKFLELFFRVMDRKRTEAEQ